MHTTPLSYASSQLLESARSEQEMLTPSRTFVTAGSRIMLPFTPYSLQEDPHLSVCRASEFCYLCAFRPICDELSGHLRAVPGHTFLNV